MKKVSWKWSPSGDGVEIDGFLYRVDRRRVEVGFDTWKRELDEIRRVAQILHEAQGSFRLGEATNYAGAATRVRDLLRELSLVEERAAETGSRVEQFFVPLGLWRRFEHDMAAHDGKSFAEFLNEACAFLSTLPPEPPASNDGREALVASGGTSQG